MKILVLGAGGMAGHVISLSLQEAGHIVDTLSATHPINKDTHIMDVTDFEKFRAFLDSKDYDVVINCIALLTKQSDKQKDLAILLNSYLPHFLERYYHDSQTKIIHLSTDGVFSGEVSSYDESAPYDGQGFYDRSKALGEIINTKDLTLRTSIVGPDHRVSGIGLFNWFFQQTGEVSGFDKVLWTGVTTIELARGINEAIQQNLSGVYHFLPQTSISKYDLLKLFAKVFERKDITVKRVSDTTFNRTLVNTRSDFNFKVSSYETMIKEMRDWIRAHKHLYKHYLS